MTEARLAWRRRIAPRAVIMVLLVQFLVLHTTPSPAQQPAPAAIPTTEQSPASTDLLTTDPGNASEDVFGDAGECHPPSTQEWVLIGLGTLAIFIVCFFLLVRLIQRYYIRQDKNATLGRHLGISLTFLVSSLGMVGLAYLVTSCLHQQFLVWLCFPLALWLIHLIYALAVVRNE